MSSNSTIDNCVYCEGRLLISKYSNGCVNIILNNPQRLNALNYEMLTILLELLLKWRKDDTVKFIVFSAREKEGEKEKKGKGKDKDKDKEKEKKKTNGNGNGNGNNSAFSAGGDMRELSNCIVVPKNQRIFEPWQFIWIEYRLDLLLAVYPKPILSLVHGYAMGGGAAVAIHPKYTIVTEKAIFAMPENNAYYIVDVLIPWPLSKIHSHIGEYLALTGTQIDYKGMLYTGLAQCHVPSHKLKDLQKELISRKINNNQDIDKEIQQILKLFSSEVSYDDCNLYQFDSIINECFRMDNVEAIIEKLHQCAQTDSIETATWCQNVRKKLLSLSPLNLKLTLRVLRDCRDNKASLGTLAQLCYRVCCRLLVKEHFHDGVQNWLVHKKHINSIDTEPPIFQYGLTHKISSQLTKEIIDQYIKEPANIVFELEVKYLSDNNVIIQISNKRKVQDIPAVLKIDDIVEEFPTSKL